MMQARTTAIRQWLADARQRDGVGQRLFVAFVTLTLVLSLAGGGVALSGDSVIESGAVFDADSGPELTVTSQATAGTAEPFPDAETVQLGADAVSSTGPVTTTAEGVGAEWLAVEPTLDGESLAIDRGPAEFVVRITGDWESMAVRETASVSSDASLQADGSGDIIIEDVVVANLALVDTETGETLAEDTSDGNTATFSDVSVDDQTLAVTAVDEPVIDDDQSEQLIGDWTGGDWFSAIFSPYILLLGEGLVGTILAGALILAFWIHSGNVVMPSILVLLLGGVLTAVLPGDMVMLARAMIVVGLTAALLAVARKYII